MSYLRYNGEAESGADVIFDCAYCVRHGLRDIDGRNCAGDADNPRAIDGERPWLPDGWRGLPQWPAGMHRRDWREVGSCEPLPHCPAIDANDVYVLWWLQVFSFLEHLPPVTEWPPMAAAVIAALKSEQAQQVKAHQDESRARRRE